MVTIKIWFITKKKNKILLIDWAHAKEEKYEQGKGEPFIIPGIGDDDY